ncbi:hypothetical protein, partial [Klebsiella michiganensis]
AVLPTELQRNRVNGAHINDDHPPCQSLNHLNLFVCRQFQQSACFYGIAPPDAPLRCIYTPNGAYRNPLTGQQNRGLLSVSLITRPAAAFASLQKSWQANCKTFCI